MPNTFGWSWEVMIGSEIALLVWVEPGFVSWFLDVIVQENLPATSGPWLHDSFSPG